MLKNSFNYVSLASKMMMRISPPAFGTNKQTGTARTEKAIMNSGANVERDSCHKSAEEDCLDNNWDGCMGHTTKTFVRSLFGTIALAVCIGLSSMPAVAQSPSRPELPRDLQSIVDAKLLRVGYTLRSAFVACERARRGEIFHFAL